MHSVPEWGVHVPLHITCDIVGGEADPRGVLRRRDEGESATGATEAVIKEVHPGGVV